MQCQKRDDESGEYNITDFSTETDTSSAAIINRMKEICDYIRAFISRIIKDMLKIYGGSFKNEPSNYVVHVVVHYIILTCVSVRHIVLNFLECASEVRKQYMLTRYHRSNADDIDSGFQVT